MFKLHELRELIKIIDQSSIQEFKIDHEGSKLTLRKQISGQVVTTYAAPQVQQPVVPAQQQAAPVINETIEESANQAVSTAQENAKNIDKNLHQIKSPMVGTFYRSPSPDADPYVKEGDKVSENSVVCIIEAMKLFNEIEAEVKGEIVEVLVENGQLVEYGQPLFLVKL